LLDALIDYRLELVLWVLCSILVYGLSANLLHRLRRAPLSRLGRRVSTFERWPHSLWVSQALRFIYYLVIPYLALTRGVTNPVLMGMWAPDWFQPDWYAELALGMGLGIGALLLLLWGWRHAQLAAAATDVREATSLYEQQRKVFSAPWGWGLIVLDALYLEIHWAFYRGATVRVLGDYYGVFAGFLLVLAEWWLNPAVRKDTSVARRNGDAITTMAIAFGVSAIYCVTANLWLCLAVHLLMQFGLLSLLPLTRVLPDHEGEGE
jgi:hypothetical protein